MNEISLRINGQEISARVEPREQLADFLREHMLLTGTHLGCEHGICGACTVLIDGEPARSCITYAVMLDGAEVTTVEGLDDDPVAEELRRAFKQEHGLQCGYCTPGMMVMARDIVRRWAGRREAEDDSQLIRRELSGNLCRCTGYAGIVRAVRSVLDKYREVPEAIPAIPPASAARVPLPGAALAVTVSAVATAASESTAPASAQKAQESGADPGAKARASPMTRIDQQFRVNHPRDTVWAFFQDTEKVAACMPGARIQHVSDDGRSVTGEIQIKLGPMGATFVGAADISFDAESYGGNISGRGEDRRSRTAAHGRVDFTLEEAENGAATDVSVAVSYALAGPLAQFSRGGIARDLAARMTATFAENLEAAVSGKPGQSAQKPDSRLDAGALLWAVVRGWIRRIFGRR